MDKSELVWWMVKHISWVRMWLRLWGMPIRQKAVTMHVDEEDRSMSEMGTLQRGNQSTIIINESGLYSLILSSKLESAKRFKRWVTSEVLPQIRKNGRYELEQHDEQLGSLIPMRAIQFPPRECGMGRVLGLVALSIWGVKRRTK